MWTLEEAIKHAKYIVNNRKDAISVCWSVKDCKQLATYLRELQEIRKDRDYWQEKAHGYEKTIHKLTDAISKQPEIVRCGECVNQYKPTCPFGVWINTPDDGHCHWAERRTDK